MTMAITFDTLKFVRQAEAQAEAYKTAHDDNVDILATKSDIKDLKNTFRHEMLRQKNDMIKWVLSIVFGVATAQAAVILAAMRWLH